MCQVEGSALVRLRTHAQALAAVDKCKAATPRTLLGLAAPKRELAVKPLYNETPYKDSGWCNFEQGAAMIAAGLGRTKLADISGGTMLVFRVNRPPTAAELERRIRRAVFTGKGDREVRCARARLGSVAACAWPRKAHSPRLQ